MDNSEDLKGKQRRESSEKEGHRSRKEAKRKVKKKKEPHPHTPTRGYTHVDIQLHDRSVNYITISMNNMANH